MTKPLLTVVIPTLDEERWLAGLLEDLRALDVPHEVIVVDGGSEDATTRVAARLGARVIASRRGRGTQLATGARAACAELMCFLHADVRLHDRTRRDLALLARSRPAGAFAFRLRIDRHGWRYRFIEFGAHLRARLFQLPYGDQGLVVSRADYEAAGGYLDIPLMEDVALVDALRRITSVRLLRSTLPVSARRWERDGPLTRMLQNWRIMIAYRLGASPHQIAARYLPQGESVTGRATAVEHG